MSDGSSQIAAGTYMPNIGPREFDATNWRHLEWLEADAHVAQDAGKTINDLRPQVVLALIERIRELEQQTDAALSARVARAEHTSTVGQIPEYLHQNPHQVAPDS
jgi:hypothetical protein